MADNVQVTPGSGKTIATDEVTDGTLGTVQVQYTKLMDGTIDSTNKLVVTSGGAAKVDGSAVIQPVSGTVTAVQATGTNLHAVIDSGTLTAVTAITNPLPAGTNVIGHVIADSGSTTVITGNVTVVQPTGTNLHVVVDSAPSTAVTGTVTSNQGTAAALAGAWPVELTDGTNVLGIAAHPVRVDPTGTTTQPVSGTVAVTQSTSPWVENVSQFGGSAVSLGSKVSASSMPVVVASDQSAIPVTGTFFQATQPISGTVTDNQGAPNSVGNAWPIKIVDAGGTNVATVDAGGDLQVDVNNPIQIMAASLSVTATGASAAAVTATLPAVAGQFHYIVGLEIETYSILARTGSATPVIVTSTNLPGSNAWTFSSAAAIGTTDTKYYTFSANPYKSSVANTNTTIVCPATTSIIWRINVYYFTAV